MTAALLRGTIAGLGSALPPTTVTNDDLATSLDTSDEWIVARTGIRERRVGGTTVGLAAEAGAMALANSGVDPDDVGLLIVATTTPDQTMPGAAAHVHRALGLGGGSFDLNAACAGFTYALIAGYSMLASGLDHVLVIGADTMSRHLDWADRTTCVLFGDGAGAAVLSATDAPRGMLGFHMGTDGEAADALFADLGGPVQMQGREVYRNAVRAVVDSSTAALARAAVAPSDIDLVVPHQANTRIIDAFSERLAIPCERIVVNLDHVGNTSAASIPLALHEAADGCRLSRGDTVLLTGFGAGMTWASIVVRW